MRSLKTIVFFFLFIFVFPMSARAEQNISVFPQTGHSTYIRSVAISPDGRHALSLSEDKTVKLWDVETGREIKTYTGHANSRRIVFSTGKAFLSLTSDGDKAWNLATGKEEPINQFPQSDLVNLRRLSPDGKYGLITYPSYIAIKNGLQSGDVGLMNTTNEELERIFKGHRDTVDDMGFSPDGKYAFSASRDKTLRVWNVSTGKEISALAHDDWVRCAAFSADGKFIVSGENLKIRLWDFRAGKEIRTFPGSRSFCVAVSSDGKKVLAGGDKELRLWDVGSGKEVRIFKGAVSEDRIAIFSPDGRSILAGGIGNPAKLWDAISGRKIRTYSDIQIPVAFSPDGKQLCSRVYLSNSGYYLKLWETDTGREISSLGQTRYNWGDILKISPDGRFVLMAIAKQLMLRDASSGRELRTFNGHQHDISSIAFSPDGKSAISAGGYDRVLKLWDLGSGSEIRTFTGHKGPVHQVIFTPDGKHVLSGGDIGSYSGEAILWDVSIGKDVRRFAHNDYVFAVAVSPDGKLLLTGGLDHKIKLWDLSTGKEIRTFSGHTGKVGSVSFSKDGHFALSCSEDWTKRIWNIKTGQEVLKLVDFDDGEWIAITPGGYFNASANGAKHINVGIGTDVYSVDQFYTKFYRPELVELALIGKELIGGDNLGEVIAKKPAPSLELTSPREGFSTDQDKIGLSLKLKDLGGGIGNVVVYINGTQVANQTRGLVIKEKEEESERKISLTVPVVEGTNEIRALAFNLDNTMESSPARVNIFSKTSKQLPKLHALIIGINEYRNKSISLTYAVSDAQEFAKTLKRVSAPLFDKTEIQILTSPETTTKDAIIRAFEGVRARIKPNDLFLFYDASHGVVDFVDNEEQYFLLTSNVLLLSSRHIGKDALGQKELARLIGSIPALKKVVILDTCNAGKGGKDIQVALLQQTRGLTESTAVKLLQRAIGSAVFSASSDTQQALEGYRNHGLFTYVLLEGLQGKADLKKDGYITILGLADYVEEQVMKLSEEVFKRQQTPTIQTGANFPIGKVK